MILSGIILYLSDLEFLPKTCWRFASSCSILWAAQRSFTVRSWRRRNGEFRLQQRRGRTASADSRGSSQPEYGNHDAKTDDGAGCHPVPESPTGIARRKRKPVLRGLLRHLRAWQCGGYRAGAAAKLGLPLLSVPQ